MAPTGGEFTAQHYFAVPSAPYGSTFTYWLGQEAEDASIAVTDADGNEMWSQDVASTRGMHTVTWNLRGQAQPIPLSPSERRDSIAIVARVHEVADSLVEAGEDREQVDGAVERLLSRSGGFGGFGGGGGGEGLPFTRDGEFVERPAEGGPIEAGGDDQSLQQRISQIVRPTEGRRRFRRGGGSLLPGRSEPAAMAEPGRYTVTLTVDGETYVQRVDVGWALSAPSS
jgi:hypothetical protein